jgi:hypothetical protein
VPAYTFFLCFSFVFCILGMVWYDRRSATPLRVRSGNGNRNVYLVRRSDPNLPAAMRTNFGNNLMFHNLKQFLGEFKDLAAFNMMNWLLFKAMAALAIVGNMCFDYVGLRYLPQRCSRMSGLSTTLTTALTSKTLGSRFDIAITGGRFGTIGTVHCPTALQERMRRQAIKSIISSIFCDSVSCTS